MRRRRILFVITKANYGGAQRYVHELAVRFKSEYDVAVAYGEPGLLAERLREEGVRCIPIAPMQRDVGILSDLRAFIELWRIVRAERPDIAHLNSSKALVLGGIVCRLAGVRRIVSTIHGWPYLKPYALPVRALMQLGMYSAVRTAHALIFISRRDMEVPLVAVPRQKRHLVYNGVMPGTARRTTEHTSVLRALTMAELTPRKNVRMAVDAVLTHNQSATTEVVLDVMGDGELRNELEQYIRDQRAERSVRMLGFVTDYRAVLPDYDLFILPSKKEGLPYVILDAGAAGIPCIASNVDGIPEIVRHEETGLLIDPENPQTLARAIRTLVDSPHLRRAYGDALRERVRTQHDYTAMIDAVRDIYEAAA